MTNLEVYREKFTEAAWLIFEQALRGSKDDQTNHVSVEHILLALAQEGSRLFYQIMSRLGVVPTAVVALLNERKAQLPPYLGPGVMVSGDVKRLLRLALGRSQAKNRGPIDSDDILIVILQDTLSPLNRILSDLNISQESRKEILLEYGRGKAEGVQSKTRTVRIKSGPYASFTGRVQGFSSDEGTVKVAVTAFGSTRVLEFDRDELEEIRFQRQLR